MNTDKRLKELAERTGVIQYDSDGKLEKFAKLIVLECAYIPTDMWSFCELDADISLKIARRIKEHFGVE